MEFKQIKELATLVDSTDIVELEIENEGFRIRIRKEEKAEAPVQIVEKVLATPAASPVVNVSQPGPEAGVKNDHCYIEVVAPMVGTFYRAPSPDAAPYIQVGDSVSEGQILFIIEAMKMMNEIESELAGTVKEILVENGMPVEYGEPLLLIELPG